MIRKKLTRKQRTYLQYMVDYFVKNHSIPPIFNDAVESLGIPAGIGKHMVPELTKKGWLERTDDVRGKYRFTHIDVIYCLNDLVASQLAKTGK